MKIFLLFLVYFCYWNREWNFSWLKMDYALERKDVELVVYGHR